MSDSTFQYSEIRTSYTEFMNSFEKIRKSLKLNDAFFKDRLFSTVLSEILQKFIESENFSMGIKSVVLDDIDVPLGVSEQSEFKSSDSTDQLSEFSSDLRGFFRNLMFRFNNFGPEKKSRILLLLVCEGIISYKEKFNSIYLENLSTNSDDIKFGEVWEVIKPFSLVSEFNKANMWSSEMHSILSNDLIDQAWFKENYGNITFFDFFQTNIYYLCGPKIILLPNKIHGNQFYCPKSFWQKYRERFKNIEGIDKEIVDYDYVLFNNPFLVSVDEVGNIISKLDPNANPSITKFVKNPSKSTLQGKGQ